MSAARAAKGRLSPKLKAKGKAKKGKKGSVEGAFSKRCVGRLLLSD